MRHKVNGKNINIPDEFIERSRRAYPTLTLPEIVQMYLDDEGITHNETVSELTVRAKAAGTTQHSRSDKPRKTPTRKPDEIKRALVAALGDFVQAQEGVTDFCIANVERVITFEFAGEKFELTLTKKRKPKE